MRVQADVPAHEVRSIYGQRAYDVPADRCVVVVNDLTHDVEAARTEAAITFHRRCGVPPLRHLMAQTAERVEFSEHYESPKEAAMRKMKR